MQYARSDRVAGVLRQEISKIIQFELKDPRLGFVTVVDVTLTRDLRHAKVFCGVMGSPEEREQSLAALADAATFIRRQVFARMRMRHSPEIAFVLDETAEEAARIDTLLRDLKKTDAPPPESEDE